jgi:hypothetical protein
VSGMNYAIFGRTLRRLRFRPRRRPPDPVLSLEERRRRTVTREDILFDVADGVADLLAVRGYAFIERFEDVTRLAAVVDDFLRSAGIPVGDLIDECEPLPEGQEPKIYVSYRSGLS